MFAGLAFKIKVSTILKTIKENYQLTACELGTAKIQQVLILKFAFGPEKLLGLSRNAPQGSYLLTKALTKTSKKWWAGKQKGGAACPKD